MNRSSSSHASARPASSRPAASRATPAGWRLGLSMLWRDARSGELRLLVIGLIIAVAALSSVGFLADRVGRALERDAGQMLGGDLKVDSDNAPPAQWREQARSLGLDTVTTVQFPSMATVGEQAQLVSLKAVEPGYPLRGTLRTASSPGEQASEAASGIPERGTVWVDSQLLVLLGIGMGDTLQLGEEAFRVARIVTYEPDRGMQFVNVAPRAMIHSADLPATQLLGPGARLDYHFLLAGAPGAVSAFERWVTPELAKGQRLDTLESGRPEVRRALDRAQRFLALVALLAVLISAVAVALAARRFMLRHRDGMAVMRCLGASQGQIVRMLLAEFAVVGLVASAVGAVLGLGVHVLLIAALAGLIETSLPAPSLMPAVQGLVVGTWLLLGFAMPSLAQLRHVPPARVLRQDLASVQPRGVLGYLVGAMGFALIIWWFAGDLRLAGTVAGGFLGAFALFALAGAACLWLLGRVRGRLGGSPALRFALAGLVRRTASTLTQLCALAVGIMALLLLTMTRTDLIDGWQRTLPADAPNRFLINIQPDQRAPLTAFLKDAGIHPAWVAPTVRGRLVQINGQAAGAAQYDEPRAQRMVDREFNLSYAEQLPDYNRIVTGRALDPQAMEVSLEQDIARLLKLNVDDTLTFDVAGELVTVRISSVRTVAWDTFQVNFFAIMTPAALEHAPQTFLTSFHLPADQAGVLPKLVQAFPNLTVFDVDAILGQLQSVLDQVIDAVQLLFGFTLAAGLLVLGAALTATRDERMREAAVLRALGATRAQLARAQRVELWAIGGLAGLLAAGGAQVIAFALSRFVFDFEISPGVWPWLAGVALGMAAAWAGGIVALRGVLRAPPLVTLRESA